TLIIGSSTTSAPSASRRARHSAAEPVGRVTAMRRPESAFLSAMKTKLLENPVRRFDRRRVIGIGQRQCPNTGLFVEKVQRARRRMRREGDLTTRAKSGLEGTLQVDGPGGGCIQDRSQLGLVTG